MIIFDLSSLTLIDETGKIHNIDPNKSSNDAIKTFNNLSLHEPKKIINTFKNWFFLGFFETQHNIVDQLLPLLGKDNTVKFLNASLVEHNPIWGSFGEVNIKIAANIFSSSETLSNILKSYFIKVEVDYSLINTLKTLGAILFRIITSIVLITFLFLRFTFKIKKKIPSNNDWFISRGIIHSKEFKKMPSQANIAYLNSWFRPFQNSNFLKNDENSFWLGNLINPLSIIKYYFQCLFKYGFFNSIRYSLLMPYIQLNLYGESVSKLRNYKMVKSVSTFEVIYPFNDFLNFKDWNLFITIALPKKKLFSYFPVSGEVYFNFFDYYKTQLEIGNLDKNLSFKKIIFSTFNITHNSESKNCIFFTQPIFLKNEINIIKEILIYCNRYGYKLFIQLHPRTSKSNYKSISDEIHFIEHYSNLKEIKYAFIRNSSIGNELIEMGVPTFACLWGDLNEIHYKNSKYLSLLENHQQLHNIFDD